MTGAGRIPSSQLLAEANPEAMAHYRKMRAELWPSGSTNNAICEIALAAQFAVLGHERPFKVHAMRALALGAGKTQLQEVLMAGLGVTVVAFEAARAIAWLNEACAEASSSSGSAA